MDRTVECANAVTDNRELANSTDADLAQMGRKKFPLSRDASPDLEREMQVALLPPDENKSRCHHRDSCRPPAEANRNFRG